MLVRIEADRVTMDVGFDGTVDAEFPRADVQRVARNLLPAENAWVVVVGDLARIRPGIEALGLGPVTVREVGAIARE